MALVQGLEPRTPESESDVLPLHYTSMCGASSQDRTDHLILTMDTLYLLSYGSINGVVDRIRTCMSHKDCLPSKQVLHQLSDYDILASVPGLEPGHRLHDYWRFSRPLPYQLGLDGHIWRQIEVSILIPIKNHLFSKQG